ncbi:MAG: HD domain-containing protein [Actinomycetota bacterium]|nr:HD domain-containing protein [Actinomycetota bacterium]
MTLDAYGGRFHGRSVRLSLPWLGLGEWTARNPLRLHFGPLPGRPERREPEPGDVLPAYPGSRTPDGYLIDTSAPEPMAEAALWLLHLEERPAYLLRGADMPAKKDGVVRVRVEEAEALGPVPISYSGAAQGFCGDASVAGEVRELLSSVEPVLSDAELEDLEGVMYDQRGPLAGALQEIAAAREARAERSVPTTAELRERSPLYIRFGGLPEERSRDWRGGFERGVSCFRARLEDGGYVMDGAGLSGQLTMFKALSQEDRPAYLATGTEVGTGGAHEPLLASVELTPLPPGTHLRVTEEWQEVVTLAYAVDALRGFVYPAHIWRPPEPVVVQEPRTEEPARSVAEILERVVGTLLARSELHGEDHWRRVALTGARIADRTLGVDRLVVLLFALLHDAGRLRDFFDEHHAYRGARLARELLKGGELVSPDQLGTLLHAIERHDSGGRSEDPTIAACWDADRLDLWRLGVRPNPALLSTEAAVGLIEWARGLQHECLAWEEIMEATKGGT